MPLDFIGELLGTAGEAFCDLFFYVTGRLVDWVFSIGSIAIRNSSDGKENLKVAVKLDGGKTRRRPLAEGYEGYAALGFVTWAVIGIGVGLWWLVFR